MVKIEIEKPNLAMPRLFAPIQNQDDRNFFLESLQPIIAQLCEKNIVDVGDNGEALSRIRTRIDAENAKKLRIYNEAVAKEINEINQLGADLIRTRLYLIVDGKDVLKWAQKVRYVEYDKEGRVKWRVETTSNELLEWMLNHVHENFDVDPRKDIRSFVQELYEKWNNYEFEYPVTSSDGHTHTFQVQLKWRVV
ncbi:MAG: hypothetical protein AOA66_0163 [Candidatus Bathyarchaeota archaeon BA2]|nr:MAG: hypothetical protein AOA66_0163 [Candidatus Bathyarchaeota archaeon BA2]